jgi:hypothetical protein
MSVQELDLSSVAGFRAAVDWIRSNVILAPTPGAVVELRISGPDSSQASVFMDRKDAYVMAFRGRDVIYALDDDTQDYVGLLVAAGVAGAAEIEKLVGLSVSHRSLGTIVHGGGGHEFWLQDLPVGLRLLSGFSQRDGHFGALRRPLSLLVCLLAESARSPAIAYDFNHLYEMQRPVRANEAIQSYHQAVRITRWADQLFKHTLRQTDRIDKLDKRATEIRELLVLLWKSTSSMSNEKQTLKSVVQGQNLGAGKDFDFAAERLRSIARELGLTDRGDELSEIETACRNRAAVDFARAGVIVPPLGSQPTH